MRRVGRVHIESRPRESSSSSASDAASDFVRSLGWHPPPTWTEIDLEGAIEVASSALMNDLVDDGPAMPFREAEETARRFVSSCEEGARFFTNGALAVTRRGFGRTNITSAKADGGVIAVSPSEVKMIWVEDPRIPR